MKIKTLYIKSYREKDHEIGSFITTFKFKDFINFKQIN